jgi:4-amino-4-deoxy-L-arabinose transferase-like glycosyltransferase/membrane-associated phospholipid phosphatase
MATSSDSLPDSVLKKGDRDLAGDNCADQARTGARPLFRQPAEDEDRRRSLSRSLLAHALLLCLFAVAWLLDEPISRAADAWYNGSQELAGEVRQLIISLAQYAQPIGFVLAGSLIWIFDRQHRGRVLILSAAILLSGVVSSVGKTLAGRERPRDSDGIYVFHGVVNSLPDSKLASFPSGHTASAFAQSYVLSAMYPAAGKLVWPLAVGVAINRIVTVRHFPSDVAAGLWIGLAVGVFIMSRRRLIDWAEQASVAWARPIHLRTSPLSEWWPAIQEVISSRLMLAIVCLMMFWAGNGNYSLWDRDEPRFATASREMAERGDWIVPTFNGDLRPDKPILIYWLQRFAYAVVGDGPFAARLWSGIGGMIACLVTWEIGKRMFSPAVGKLAGWMLALSPMLIIESKLGTVDALLLSSIVTAMLALWQIYSGTATFRTAMLFWIALGLGILTKGPVALMVPALVTTVLVIIDRRAGWLLASRPLWGVSILGAIVLPWCGWVQWATEGKFLQAAIGHHVVTRALQPLENHSGFPGYYVVSWLGLMAPWSLLLPIGLVTHRHRLWTDARWKFLLAWGITTLVVFEIVRTKLVHYYLPAYPAWGVFIAASLVGVFAGEPIGLDRLPRFQTAMVMMVMGWGTVLVGGIAACALLPIKIALPLMVAVTIGGVGLVLAGRLFSIDHVREAITVQMAAGVLMITLVGAQVLPAIHSSQVILDVADRLGEIGEREPIALWYYRDPSLIYNLKRQVPVIDPLRAKPPLLDARELAAEKGMFVCPVTPDQLRSMKQDEELSVHIRQTLSKWDIKGLREQEVHLVEVRPARVAKEPSSAVNR